MPGILDDDFYTLYGGCGKQQQAGNRPHPAGEIDSETTGLVGKRTSRLFQKGNDSMKRSCKEIDITDWQTDYPWVLACILKHRKRHDFRMLLCKIGGMQKRDYYTALQEADKSAFEEPARNIAKEAARRIAKRRLDLKPVQIREKVDRSSGKVRLIGKESAMQQVLDYIAKEAADEIWKRRIVPQQASSVAGRGQIYGAKMIQSWILADSRAARWAKMNGQKYSRKCKYFVKLDVKKCYQSMRVEMFMEQFRRDCGNETLLWLWETLLKSHRADGYEGFMIGALPSQWGCQYIMSFIYRFAMGLHKERRGKRIRLVSHSLFYMDDILLTGSSRKDLKLAVNRITKYARERFGLTIKPDWHIQKLEDTPIDMMGYVIHADGNITIRPRVFLRARRMALKSNRRQGKMCVRQAQRICSYKGYFKNSNSRKICKKLKLGAVFRGAARIVSISERRRQYDGNLQHGAGKNTVHAVA